MASKINTIIFDLSEVYLNGLYGTHIRINEKYGAKLGDHDMWKMSELRELFTGQITEDQYWQSVINKFDINADIEGLKQAVRENFKEIEGTRNIIESLNTNGYKLGLLSDHARDWVQHCETNFDYHKLFHSVLYSFEVETCKPDRLVFEKILEKLEAQPEQTLFIDDWPANLTEASKLGIKTIQFTSAESLSKELKKAGIKI